jgi:hypothetical protein
MASNSPAQRDFFLAGGIDQRSTERVVAKRLEQAPREGRIRAEAESCFAEGEQGFAHAGRRSDFSAKWLREGNGRPAPQTTRELGEITSSLKRVNRTPESVEMRHNDRALSTARNDLEAALEFHEATGASELTLRVDAHEFACANPV